MIMINESRTKHLWVRMTGIEKLVPQTMGRDDNFYLAFFVGWLLIRRSSNLSNNERSSCRQVSDIC
uniref:Uncharacterized protein n=1 Tax=Rhizophora mucronata TaxID=61149 RepID=A0A2P2QK74_RHIMU